MEIEKWESIGVGKDQPQPLVTFTLSKTIRFNKACVEEYNLQNASYATVLYNKQENKIKIGFMFLDEQKENTLKLSMLNGSGAFISAHKIFRVLGINDEELRSKYFKRRFVPYLEEYKNNKLLVIDIPIKKENENEKE